MRHALTALFILSISASALQAEGFRPVQDRETFIDLVDGRELRLGLFGVRLNVTADGRIDGRAVTAPVTGNWYWQDGYFCREMDWSGQSIPYDCQLVEVSETRQMRFTVNRGTGESATFRLR